jgi:hypothetical protein
MVRFYAATGNGFARLDDRNGDWAVELSLNGSGAQCLAVDPHDGHGGDSRTQFRYRPALPFGQMRGLVAVLALLVPFAGGSEAARPPVPRGEIFVVGVEGRGRQNLTRTAATESELALSPDGRPHRLPPQ